MGWSFRTFVVDVDRVDGAFNSGDAELLQLIEEMSAEELAEDAELSLEEEWPTLTQALRLWIMGTCDDEDWVAERSEEAYEHICETLCSASRGNGPYGREWLEHGSRGLEQLGIDGISFEAFRDSSSWSHEGCVRAVAQWESVTVQQRSGVDSKCLDAVEEVIEVARMAAQSPGYGVVCFFGP